MYMDNRGMRLDNRVNQAVLDTIIRRAKETGTSSLLIWHDGELVYKFGDEKKMSIYSITKSFVSLAIGFLIDEGKITSLEEPVSKWFPERADWKEGGKAKVTLRTLLDHSSGLKDYLYDWGSAELLKEDWQKFNSTDDVLKFALDRDVLFEPGSKYYYSNSALDVAAGVVQRASGERIDHYLNERLFKPLGISDWVWRSTSLDLSKLSDSEPNGAAGLELCAQDLLKLGEMMLNLGVYQGKRILSQASIKTMILETNRDEAYVYVPLTPLTDQLNATGTGYVEVTDQGMPLAIEPIKSALCWRVPASSTKNWPPKFFSAEGYLGQKLLVLPEHKLIAIRMYDYKQSNLYADVEKEELRNDLTRMSFSDFSYWVTRLMPL